MSRPNVSAERKQQILDAASRVFLRKGLDAARMEDIAAEAGLSVGGVYWYFKSKEEVVHALIEAIIDPDLRGLHELLDAGGTVLDRLGRYVRSTTPGACEQLPLTSEILGLASRDESTRSRLLGYLTAYRDVIATLLQQGITRGEFQPFPVAAVAIAIAALSEGVAELKFIDPALDAEQAFLDGIQLLLGGFANRDPSMDQDPVGKRQPVHINKGATHHVA